MKLLLSSTQTHPLSLLAWAGGAVCLPQFVGPLRRRYTARPPPKTSCFELSGLSVVGCSLVLVSAVVVTLFFRELWGGRSSLDLKKKKTGEASLFCSQLSRLRCVLKF